MDYLPQILELDLIGDQQEWPQLADDLELVQVSGSSKWNIFIGANLLNELKACICELLKQNRDLFAWTPVDMPCFHPEVICHKLTINSQARPMAKKKCRLRKECQTALIEQKKKLLKVNIIR